MTEKEIYERADSFEEQSCRESDYGNATGKKAVAEEFGEKDV